MLLKCRTLYALKFALVSKNEAMYHLALENMKNIKVKKKITVLQTHEHTAISLCLDGNKANKACTRLMSEEMCAS